ncbi:MAG: hypothetical protein ACRDSZ_07055 [Pseudonocardiaceae bacterium]
MCVLLGSGGEVVDKPAGDGGSQPCLATGYRSDRCGDLGGDGIFEEEA